MKRTKFFNRPTRLSEMSYDDYYDTSDRQTGKAQRLQLKKWRKLKHQLI